MATDYDAPRTPVDEEPDTSLTQAATSRADAASTAVDPDEANLAEDLELPGADLSDQALSVHVLPIQADEFTCARCFLVVHASRRAPDAPDMCTDCA